MIENRTYVQMKHQPLDRTEWNQEKVMNQLEAGEDKRQRETSGKKQTSHMFEHDKHLHKQIGIMHACCIVTDRVQYIDMTLQYVSNQQYPVTAVLPTLTSHCTCADWYEEVAKWRKWHLVKQNIASRNTLYRLRQCSISRLHAHCWCGLVRSKVSVAKQWLHTIPQDTMCSVQLKQKVTRCHLWHLHNNY